MQQTRMRTSGGREVRLERQNGGCAALIHPTRGSAQNANHRNKMLNNSATLLPFYPGVIYLPTMAQLLLFRANGLPSFILLSVSHFLTYFIENYYEKRPAKLPSLMVSLSIFRCHPAFFQSYSFSSSSLFKKFFTNWANGNHCSEGINQKIVLALWRQHKFPCWEQPLEVFLIFVCHSSHSL